MSPSSRPSPLLPTRPRTPTSRAGTTTSTPTLQSSTPSPAPARPVRPSSVVRKLLPLPRLRRTTMRSTSSAPTMRSTSSRPNASSTSVLLRTTQRRPRSPRPPASALSPSRSILGTMRPTWLSSSSLSAPSRCPVSSGVRPSSSPSATVSRSSRSPSSSVSTE